MVNSKHERRKKQAIFRSAKPMMKNSLLRLAKIANHELITSLALTKITQ